MNSISNSQYFLSYAIKGDAKLQSVNINEPNANQSKLPSIEELSRSIDPRSMSRNESREIAEAIGRSGNLTIDNAFALQSMVLVDKNGAKQTATQTDTIMNKKFNMFDALKSQIEFNKSKGFSTSHLEDGLSFLEKLDGFRQTPSVNVYT